MYISNYLPTMFSFYCQFCDRRRLLFSQPSSSFLIISSLEDVPRDDLTVLLYMRIGLRRMCHGAFKYKGTFKLLLIRLNN